LDVAGITYIQNDLRLAGQLLLTPLGSYKAGIATNGNDMIFMDSGAVERMRIKDGGNVGIGTTDPAGYKLKVAGIVRASTGFSTGDEVSIGNLDETTDYIKGTINLDLIGTEGHNLSIRDWDNVIIKSGNVGIGTTAPGVKLDVQGDAASNYIGNFFNDGNDDNRYGIKIQAGADTPSAGRWIQFNDGDGGDIGTISLVASVLTLTTTSDQRLKENINDTVLSLETLRNIKVRDFSFIHDQNHNIVHGFVAQELREVYPDAVLASSDPEAYWGVSYSQLTPLIVKSIQDLDLKLREMEEMKEDSNFAASLKDWLASAANGIEDFFANRIRTKELCISDDSGGETCITKADLDRMLNAQVSGSGPGSESSTDTTKDIIENTVDTVDTVDDTNDTNDIDNADDTDNADDKKDSDVVESSEPAPEPTPE
jgi:hypothetical protein